MKITCYSYSDNPDVRNITWLSLEFYCKKHGYRFRGFTESIEKEYKKHWNKIHYGINLLKEDDSEYIVWFDHDIIIKNFDIKLEDIIKEYGFDEGEQNLMLSKEVKDFEDKAPLNTGVIVFKNNEENLHTFNSFLTMRTCPADFAEGFQDTLAIYAHYNKNPQDFLCVPHRVLQSNASVNQLFCYKKGDFCGHVSGDQGPPMLIGLNELINS